MRFFLLNVSDNANYGDLLFPLILTRHIKEAYPEAEIVNYAPMRSDWSGLGALPTKSYRDFINDFKKAKPDLIVVGGGGLFNTAWTQLFWRLNPTLRKALSNRHIRRLLWRNDFVRRILSPIPIHLPFVLSYPLFSDTRVFYNSVGGFPMDHRALNEDDLIHLRRETTLLSVRDDFMFEALSNYGLPVKQVPDSALIMSDEFPVATLVEKSRTEVDSYSKGKRYIFFQLGTDLGPKDLETFTTELADNLESDDCKILVSPIKYRIAHRAGDEEILERIADQDPRITLVRPKNLFETMLLIARSQAYLGTSLHGFITGYSYGVPSFGFSNVGKLKGYLETWTDVENHLVDIDKAPNLVERISSYQLEEANARCASQKQEVYENLARLKASCIPSKSI